MIPYRDAISIQLTSLDSWVEITGLWSQPGMSFWCGTAVEFLNVGGWMGSFGRMCVSNFLFTLGLLPRMMSLRGWAFKPKAFSCYDTILSCSCLHACICAIWTVPCCSIGVLSWDYIHQAIAVLSFPPWSLGCSVGLRCQPVNYFYFGDPKNSLLVRDFCWIFSHS